MKARAPHDHKNDEKTDASKSRGKKVITQRHIIRHENLVSQLFLNILNEPSINYWPLCRYFWTPSCESIWDIPDDLQRRRSELVRNPQQIYESVEIKTFIRAIWPTSLPGPPSKAKGEFLGSRL